MATPIDRGPGSRSADFTAPSVPVTNTGPQLSPQQTDFERFRDAVVTAGRGVAAAVNARASINARLKSLKEQSVARVEGDLRLAAGNMQQKRLERAAMQRTQVLAEAGSRGMEWAEREFRTGMVNAGSQEEAQLWERAWQGAAQQVSRENAEAKQQSFNAAKRTMSTVARSLNQALAQDPALQQELIGDGTNIGARVQNWMLTEMAEMVDLDNLDSEDADFLVHQMVSQSFGISDSLIETHSAAVRSSNEALASQQVEADTFSTVQGDQSAGALQRQIDITLRDRLSHLSFDQQRDYVRGVVSTQMQEMASGTHGIDAIGKLGTGADLLGIRVNGDPLFSDQERQEIATEMLGRAQRTVGRLVDSEIARLREAQTQVVTLPDGRTVHRPVANPDIALMTPDPITGLTPLEDAGNKVLADLGFLGATDLSPEGALIVGAVREKTMGRASAAGEGAAKQVESFANQRAVFDGMAGGNATNAHRDSIQRRVFMSPDALTAAGLPAPSAEEVGFLRGALLDMAGVEGSDLDMEAIRQWDGGPIDITPENMGLVKAVQTFDAQKWSNGPTQDMYGIPKAMAEEKLSLLRSDDPAKVEAFSHWVSNLAAGTGGAWQNFLGEVSGNEAAAASLIRIQARLGTGPQRVAPDAQRMVGQVQSVLAAPSPATWFGLQSGEPKDTVPANVGTMAEVLTAAISDTIPDIKFKGDKQDPYARNLQAQLTSLLASDSGNGRMLRDLYFAGVQSSPDLAPEAVGSMVWGWVQQSGWRFREIGGQQKLIVDPNGYTGEEGEEISENIADNLTREFSPHYRAFLADALGTTPLNTPRTLQDLYIQTNQQAIGQTDPTQPTTLIPRYGFDDTVTSRLLRSRADYGGFEFRLGLPDGTDLGNVLSVREATLHWQDGTTTVVPKNTPLNVFNPDIFADAPINRVAGTSPMDTLRAESEVARSLFEGAAPATPAEAAKFSFYNWSISGSDVPSEERVPIADTKLSPFLSDVPLTLAPARLGPDVGPPSGTLQSRSIFNRMAEATDRAAKWALSQSPLPQP